MRFLGALGVIAMSLAIGAAADASCAELEPVAQRVARADAVVWGTVTGVGGGLLTDRRSLTVRVQAVYKGSVPVQLEVRVGPEIEGQGPGQVGATSVDYSAAPGSSHTFYLKRHAPGGFTTDACGGSHEGEPTPDELAVLGAPRAPEPGSGSPGSPMDLSRVLAAAAVVAALGLAYFVLHARLAR